jgi:type IV secretory pathway VirB10-like protein
MGEYKTASLTYGKRRIYVLWSSIRTPEGAMAFTYF